MMAMAAEVVVVTCKFIEFSTTTQINVSFGFCFSEQILATRNNLGTHIQFGVHVDKIYVRMLTTCVWHETKFGFA